MARTLATVTAMFMGQAAASPIRAGRLAGGGSASGGSSDRRCARKPMASTGACGTSILSLPGT
ncbi:hypothetical protein BST25_18700 [Mycobacterium heidelbergense]|uniref:Uncharacterized protein n=1 Tax=Mycobacterium heidelbergense TaxID=53376 RepID=A0A1X0DFQ6_MYCHE|nr:hypothetical protein BST25_18700 [Mycobacterium heidelbergense]